MQDEKVEVEEEEKEEEEQLTTVGEDCEWTNSNTIASDASLDTSSEELHDELSAESLSGVMMIEEPAEFLLEGYVTSMGSRETRGWPACLEGKRQWQSSIHSKTKQKANVDAKQSAKRARNRRF